MSATSDEVEKFKEIVRSNGITDKISNVEIKDAGLKGEGFASVTRLVKVNFEDEKLKPLNLFVKLHSSNASHTEMLEEMKAFQKEATFLLKYQAAAKEMCRQKGHDGFIDFYPKCYYGDDKMIVLENIVLDRGYELMNKETLQDFDTAAFALTTLAKHHAIGHVMIEESGGPEAFFQKFPTLDHEAFDTPKLLKIMEESYTSALNTNIKIVQQSNIKDAGLTVEKIKGYMGKPNDIVLKAMKPQDGDCIRVLGHGDYWNNNQMYLVDKTTNKIIHEIAIDLQITRYNSPALDLSYFLYTSVKKEVRQNRLKELLQVYLEALNKFSDQFGHPINLSYEELFLEFRKKFAYGFWYGFTMAVGPGMALWKDLDVNDIDLDDYVEFYERAITKWIEEHPDKTDEFAEEIKRLFEEYESLGI